MRCGGKGKFATVSSPRLTQRSTISRATQGHDRLRRAGEMDLMGYQVQNKRLYDVLSGCATDLLRSGAVLDVLRLV